MLRLSQHLLPQLRWKSPDSRPVSLLSCTVYCRCSQLTRTIHNSENFFLKCSITGQGHLFPGSPTFTRFCLEINKYTIPFNIFLVPSHTFPSFATCCQSSFDFRVVKLLMLQQGGCGNVSAWICHRFLKRQQSGECFPFLSTPFW